MPEYSPAYRNAAPLTLEHLRAELEGLRSMHTYAAHHDDVLVLDELFCRVVALEHAVIQWDREAGELPRVRDSLTLLDRALKWAWLAREEESHAGGMYAAKLKEAIAVLAEMELFLESVQQPQETPEERPAGMTREQAEGLARTIKARLPQAEVAVQEGEGDLVWVVEARNPYRGTTQTFRDPEQFERLMEEAARRPRRPSSEDPNVR
jgi:hypothetical protein